MAPPQVIGNDNPSLESQCLAFIQTLVAQEIGFSFQLTSGSFSCSFVNNGKRKITSARIPTQVKHKSPSTLKRNARRRQQFLENKKFRASSVDCEQPDHVESTQSHSESICAPSPDPTDVEKNNLCDGYRKEREEVQKVPPLDVSVNSQSSPNYRLQQSDGACSLSDEDTNDTDSDDQSEILCAMCNLKMTPTHQCCETQLKSKYDKFMYDCEKGIAAGLHYVMKIPQTGNLKFNITEAKIEKALLEFRLKNDFESWQRGHINY